MRKRKNHPLKLDDQKSLGEPLTKRLASNVLIQAREILGSQAFSSELEKLRKFIVKNLSLVDIKQAVQEEFSNLPQSVSYPVHTAVFQGKLDDIGRLVEEKKSAVNEILNSDYYRTPLELACCINNVDIVRFLLSLGASLDTPSAYFPIIYYALRSGNLEIIKLLIEKGVSIIPNNLEDLALNYVQPVLRGGEISLIKYLFEKWIVAKNETLVLQSAVLLWIAGVSNERCLSPLLYPKAFDEILTNILTNKKLVAKYVMRFCPKKRLSALHQKKKLLLSAWVDDNEQTLAHRAVYWENRSAVRFLSEHHRDLFFKKDKFNNTLISLSASSRLSVFKIIEQLPDAEAQLPEGRRWSHLAAMNGNLDVLEYLYIKNSDSLKLRDNQGETPLGLAVKWGRLPLFRFIVRKYRESIEWIGNAENVDELTIVGKLIQVWSDLEPFSGLQLRRLALFEEIIHDYPKLLTREDHNGYAPIAYAVAWGRVKLVETILRHFPDLYQWKHASGQTLIHQAAQYNHPELYNYFKENYPEYTQSTLTQKTTDEGLTPLGMAAVNASLDVFKRLEEDNKTEALLQTRHETVVYAIIGHYNSDARGQTSQQKKFQEMLAYISKNYSKSLFIQEGHFLSPIVRAAERGASRLLPILIEKDSKCHEWSHPILKMTLESRAAEHGHVHLLEDFKKRDWLNLQSLTDFSGNSRLEIAKMAMEGGHFNTFKWYQNNIPKELQSTWPIEILYFLMTRETKQENLKTVIDLAKSGDNTSFSIVELIDNLIRGVGRGPMCFDTAVAVKAKSYWFLAYLLAKKIQTDVTPESLKKELQDLIDSSANRFLPLYFHLCYVPDKSGYAFPKTVVHTILDYAIEYVIDSLILCVMKEEKPTTLGQQTFFFQYVSRILLESPDREDVIRTIIQEVESQKFKKSSQTQAGLFSKSTESSSKSSSASTSTSTLIP